LLGPCLKGAWFSHTPYKGMSRAARLSTSASRRASLASSQWKSVSVLLGACERWQNTLHGAGRVQSDTSRLIASLGYSARGQ
jgi:hypothetical protein